MMRSILILLLAFLTSSVRAETVYFLVAEFADPPFHNDSYVVALTDPNDIAHARNLIEYGPGIEGGHIVGASVDSWDPNDGINKNRDYLQPGMPAWSWYAIFGGFGELSVEECDGMPSAVEEEGIEAWQQGICFWSYTVVAELGSDPEPWNCDLDLTGVVDFNDLAQITSHWLDSPCCHRYWCDGADLDGSGQVDMYDFAVFARNWRWEK